MNFVSRFVSVSGIKLRSGIKRRILFVWIPAAAVKWSTSLTQVKKVFKRKNRSRKFQTIWITQPHKTLNKMRKTYDRTGLGVDCAATSIAGTAQSSIFTLWYAHFLKCDSVTRFEYGAFSRIGENVPGIQIAAGMKHLPQSCSSILFCAQSRRIKVSNSDTWRKEETLS